MITLFDIQNVGTQAEEAKRLELAMRPHVKNLRQKYPGVFLELHLMPRIWLPPKSGLRSIIVYARQDEATVNVEAPAEELTPEHIEATAEKTALALEPKIRAWADREADKIEQTIPRID